MTPHTATPISTRLDAAVARRSLLSLATIGAAAVTLPLVGAAANTRGDRPTPGSITPTPGTSTTSATTPAGTGTGGSSLAKWTGHQPGKVYLGQSYPGNIVDAERQAGTKLGAQRSFFTWDDPNGENATIKDDHANGRLPWLSFKPPAGPSTWAEVGSGARDADIRARARRYAAFSKPIVVTFHHEPTNDSTNGDAWAKAFIRIYDVMRAETGLKNVAFAPIIGDWAWNPKNPDQTLPTKFLTADVMRRMAFLGVDLYQNASGEGYSSRLGRIYSWMAGRGFGSKMLGIGETGATESFASKTAVQWWSEQWAWVGANTDKIGVISYFNSTRNSKDNVYWGLDESAVKLTAYKASLTSKISARLA